MSNKQVTIITVAALILGAVLGAYLVPQVNGFRWQMEFARLQADFGQYRQQVAPAIQMYNQAMARQQAAAQEAETENDPQ